MTQLTLRGFDPELEKRLRDMARRDGTSLNRAALQLMRRGAGLTATGQPTSPIGKALNRFAGRMSKAEANAINRTVAEARQADLKLQS